MNKVVPIWLVIVYPILVALDIFTTYLGTPDLQYEYNWLITTFDLKWQQIIFLSTLLVLAVIFFVLQANRFFQQLSYKKTISTKYVLYISILCFFFTHFFYTFYVIINNYLAYVYLFPKGNDFLNKTAIRYVNFYQSTPVYHKITPFIAFIVGVSVSAIRIRLCRKTKK